MEESYPCASPPTVTLLRRGLNDTYLVTGLKGHEQAALRVYRSAWRTPEEVAWELALIEHVAEAGCAVSRPLPRRDGAPFGVLPAVEGSRSFALFEWVEGQPIAVKAEHAAAYGHAAAALHLACEDFGPGGRFALDLDHLITHPLAAIRLLLADAPEIWGALEDCGARTHERLLALLPELEWGACHGDLHAGNARVGSDRRVHLFDFDCAGPGWRAYDLAVYLWDEEYNGGVSAQERGRVFLTAYQARRPLSGADLQAVPLFVLARSLWFMGLMAGRVSEFGTETLNRGLFEYGLDFMRKWEARQG